VEPQLAALTNDDRRSLAQSGVRWGVESVFLPLLLKPAAQRLNGVLWAVHEGVPPPPPLPPGRTLVRATQPDSFYAAIGFRTLAGQAVRVDMLERFAAEARKLARLGPFALSPPLLSLLGAGPAEGALLLASLGYRSLQSDLGTLFTPSRRQRYSGPAPSRPGSEHSPFAVLRRPVPASG
jgi:ATP-dependent RNA helicase SUPV3L1/SUV3